MYTSGTTGDPKGVLLKHSAVVTGVANVVHYIRQAPRVKEFGPGDSTLSYLPLAHIFDRCAARGFGFHVYITFRHGGRSQRPRLLLFHPTNPSKQKHARHHYHHHTHYTATSVLEEMMLHLGGRVGYFQGDTRKLMDDIAALKPTLFIGVPRIYDRIYSGVTGQIAKAGARVCLRAGVGREVLCLLGLAGCFPRFLPCAPHHLTPRHPHHHTSPSLAGKKASSLRRSSSGATHGSCAT
jgi:long-chain acyl-CoA synthetase